MVNATPLDQATRHGKKELQDMIVPTIVDDYEGHNPHHLVKRARARTATKDEPGIFSKGILGFKSASSTSSVNILVLLITKLLIICD